MCWLSWFSGPGCCSSPGSQSHLVPADSAPELAFCFMGPWTFAWICCPQLPYHPCKNGTHGTAQGGTRRQFCNVKITYMTGFLLGKHLFGVATPAEPRSEKILCFCANFGRWKNFKIWWKSAGEIFLSGLRGAKTFSNAFRIVFRILFRVFQTVFRIDLKVFRGQFRSARVPP